MLPDKVWVASISDVETGDAIQVCSSREVGLKWLVSKIDPAMWLTFYNALKPEDREGLTSDMSGMAPEQILDAWAGREQPNVDEWGSDMHLITLEEQGVLS